MTKPRRIPVFHATRRNGCWWIALSNDVQNLANEDLTPLDLYDCAGSERLARSVGLELVTETKLGIEGPFRAKPLRSGFVMYGWAPAYDEADPKDVPW